MCGIKTVVGKIENYSLFKQLYALHSGFHKTKAWLTAYIYLPRTAKQIKNTCVTVDTVITYTRVSTAPRHAARPHAHISNFTLKYIFPIVITRFPVVFVSCSRHYYLPSRFTLHSYTLFIYTSLFLLSVRILSSI